MKRLNLVFEIALLWTAVGIILSSIPAHAAQYESLLPLLSDFSGWEAEEAEGIDMDMGGTKMIQAMRLYTQGNKEVGAMVMIGNSMMTQAQMQGMQSMETESQDAKVQVTTVDGFQVSLHHVKNAAEGAVVVSLASSQQKGATFVLHYKGLSEDEGLAFAKKFDWKKMQQAAKELM